MKNQTLIRAITCAFILSAYLSAHGYNTVFGDIVVGRDMGKPQQFSKVSSSRYDSLYFWCFEVNARNKSITNDLVIPNYLGTGNYDGNRFIQVEFAFRVGNFSYCSNLTSIVIQNIKIPTDANARIFSGMNPWMELPQITEITDEAFKGCAGLTNVVIPAEIKTMPNCLFAGCDNLVQCNVGFQTIATDGFAELKSLKSVSITNAIDIGAGAFRGCESLGEIELGDNLLTIGAGAFMGTTVMSNVIARCAPPNGIIESELFINYPSVSYPSEYETEWQAALAVCSSNMVVQLTPATNEVVEAGATRTIMMSCDNDDAVIYYTLDGSEPTTNSFRYSKKFKVRPEGMMTIKAAAIIDRWPYHSVQSISLAPEKCEMPTASMKDGEKFYYSNQAVTLGGATDGAVIRYTLDGSEPTEESAQYSSPILISETTTVRAKAFREDYFESEELKVTLVRDWHQVETPIITAYYGSIQNGEETTTLEGSHLKVTICCSTEGNEIHYTTDGTEPTMESPIYVAPFKMFDTTTVKAMAVKYDWANSMIAVAELTKNKIIGDVMKDPDMTFTNDATYPWLEDATVCYSGSSSMKSGEATDNAASVLSATVTGAGRVLFRWRADCEEDEYDHEFDHGEFKVDGDESADRIDGTTEWRAVDVRVEGNGAHTLAWVYQKDDGDEKSYDGGAIWVDNFVWIPDDQSKVTFRSNVEVPYNWLYDYGLLKERIPETVITMKSGKMDGSKRELTYEDDYVAGTDPTNKVSLLTSKIEMVDGAPSITWKPDLEAGRTYRIWGSTNLVNGGDWEYPTNSLHRFFKVTVEMP